MRMRALLNRAYVYSMKAHGAQLRASGDPYFSHPVEVAGILAADEARQRFDRDRAAARHGRGYGRHARRYRAAVRPGDRPAGRRRHQAVAHRAAIGPDQAGGEFPQARAGDVGGHPRAAGQARRPSAQHADAAVHQERREAPAHRARDDGDLRAAGRADRHAADEGPARGPGLRRALSRCARQHPRAARLSARQGRRPRAAHHRRAAAAS